MVMDLNDASHWREFEKNEITHSAAHYLMAINHLHDEFGYARVTNVANVLEISRGAASMALTQLKKRGWVMEDANRFLVLSDIGKQMAESVEQNFVILSQFFQDVLRVPTEVALSDACKMEHLMSLETGQRMLRFMRYIMRDKDISKRIQRVVLKQGTKKPKHRSQSKKPKARLKNL